MLRWKGNFSSTLCDRGIEMRMKIAFIARTETPNGYYRAVAPLTALAARGHLVAEVMAGGRADHNLGALAECDLLLVHRYSQGESAKAMKFVHERGVPTVWDNDDDLMAPQTRSGRRTKGFNPFERQQLVAATRRMFGFTSAVTTPSAELARIYRENGATRAEVIENYIPPELVGVPRSRDGGTVTIGWIAALEHALDVRELGLAKVLRRLLEAHPHVNVVSLGVDLQLAHERYRRLRPLPYTELGRWTGAFDVGIAPLADVRLNRSRSNVKLKEYAAAGTPWLASPVGPYVGMGEDEGGRLVADDRWYEELERLVLTPTERAKLGERGLKWARGQTIDRNAERWERLFGELVANAPARQAVR